MTAAPISGTAAPISGTAAPISGTAAPISGTAEPGFEAVRAAFEGLFEDEVEQGAALSILIDGRPVCEMIGGWADKSRSRPWTDETIACVYSTGKAATALIVAKAVEAGDLDYDAPVATWWPEFAAEGKGEVTLAEALSHQAGLSGLSEPMDPALWLDREAIVERIAAATPIFEPKSASGYHPQTIGLIADEILRRATGRSIRTALAEDFAGLSVYCGLSDAEIARAAYMPKPKAAADLGEMNAATRAAFVEKWSAPARVDRETWMRAELPASNMHGDAKAFSRMLAIVATGGLLEGERYLAPETLAAATRERVAGHDLVLPFELSWAAGFMRNTGGVYGPNPNTVGHSGFGGACAFADPDAALSFAFVPARMGSALRGDPRSMSLIGAVYNALG